MTEKKFLKKAINDALMFSGHLEKKKFCFFSPSSTNGSRLNLNFIENFGKRIKEKE